jgi:uncharacterized phiE125 gp8 family phage protein
VSYSAPWMSYPETAYDDGLRGELVTAATGDVITVDEAKDRLRRSQDTSIEDAQIEGLIQAAVTYLEEDCRLSLLTQTRRAWYNAIPCDRVFLLDRGPVQTISSVKLYDTADASTTLSSTVYQLDAVSVPARLVERSGQTWSSTTALRLVNSVAIEYVAGYGASGTSVPGPLKQAALLLVGSLWEHREQVIVAQFAGMFLDLPFGYRELTAPYRQWRAA